MGRSIDWLDIVVAEGTEAAREKILGATPLDVASLAPSSRGDRDPAGGRGEREERMLPKSYLDQARLALLDMFTAGGDESPEIYSRVWYDGCWWRFSGDHYIEQTDESLRAELRPWLHQFFKRKRMPDGEYETVPHTPSETQLSQVVAAMQTDTILDADAVPCWLRSQFEAGLPLPSRKSWERIDDDPSLPDPKWLLPAEDGLLDLRAFMEHGEIEVRKPSPRLFRTSSLPYALPLDAIRALAEADGDDDCDRLDLRDRLLEELAPTWLDHMRHVSDGDGQVHDVIAMFMGMSLVPQRLGENLLVMVGPGGYGKGTVVEGWQVMLGERHVVAGELALLNERFFADSIRTAALLAMNDTDLGRSTDSVRAGSKLKELTGGDRIYCDRKNRRALPFVKPWCEVVITSNRMIKLPDPGGGLRRRYRVLHMAARPQRRDSQRKARIQGEAAGILLDALFGLRAYVRAGRDIPQPESGRQLIAEFREHAEPVEAFVEECCKPRDDAEGIEEGRGDLTLYCRPESWEATENLARAFRWWIGDPNRDKGWFVQQLRAACPWLKRSMRKCWDGSRYWGYHGIELSHRVPQSVLAGEMSPVDSTD